MKKPGFSFPFNTERVNSPITYPVDQAKTLPETVELPLVFCYTSPEKEVDVIQVNHDRLWKIAGWRRP